MIVQCSGLFIDATVTDPYAVHTDSIRVTIAVNKARSGAALQKISMDEYDSTITRKLEKTGILWWLFPSLFLIISITQPYWLASKMADGYFNVSDQLKIGILMLMLLIASVDIDIYNERFNFQRPVRYKYQPGAGRIVSTLVVLPQVLISLMKNTRSPRVTTVRRYALPYGEEKRLYCRFQWVGKEQPEK